MRVLFLSNLIRRFYNYEPLGILSLSAALRAAGHEVSYAHATRGPALAAMRRFRPGILAFSATTGMHGGFLALNRALKAASPEPLFTILGGPHATFFPEVLEEEGVDAVCIGEGEGAILDLADRLERGEEAASIPNLHVKSGGTIAKNPVRPYITDLDRLPPPDRELIYSRFPECLTWRTRWFMASRGCPFACTYCFNHYFHKLYEGKGPRVRHRSVEHVITEVRDVRDRYPFELVRFVDDIFGLWSKEWLEEFRARFPREVGMPFSCCVMPQMVTPENSRRLREAGCVSVAMGLESGNDEIRRNVLNRNMSREQIVEAARALHAEGIAIFTQAMVGLPGGSLDTDRETLDLTSECRPEYAWVSLYAPYPRTELGERSRRMGLFDGPVDSFPASYHSRSLLRIERRAEVERLQKLFAILVEFPRLRRFAEPLLRLPLTPLYELARRLWKGYAFRRRIYPVRYPPREFLRATWKYLWSEGG